MMYKKDGKPFMARYNFLKALYEADGSCIAACELLGISRQAGHQHIEYLQKDGYISKTVKRNKSFPFDKKYKFNKKTLDTIKDIG